MAERLAANLEVGREESACPAVYEVSLTLASKHHFSELLNQQWSLM